MCVMVNEEARSLLHDYINVKYIFLTQKRLQVAPNFHIKSAGLNKFSLFTLTNSLVLELLTPILSKGVYYDPISG